MIDRIKRMLVSEAPVHRSVDAADEKALVTAILLVEAASLDGSLDGEETETIATLLRSRFSLTDEEIATLMAAAHEAQEEANQLVRFTQRVKAEFSAEERVELVEMLWEVVYSDGRLDPYEANLLRRVSGLIYVTDRETGAARKRVLRRLGLDEV